MRLLTDAGTRTVDVTPTEHPETVLVRVEMGEVIELEEASLPSGWATLGLPGPVVHLSVGNPHIVVAVDDVDAIDLAAVGAQLPDVNLEVVQPGPEPGAVTMRVHERGVGLTEACGTGACAAAVAAAGWGFVPKEAGELMVHMPGGSARVSLDAPAPGRVTLTGPATYVATIEVSLP
jgi:diaminopimelate epimerase